MARASGESAVVVVMDAVDPVVAGWRSRYDWSAAAGVPAHVTVLYPFLPLDQVTGDVIDRLAGIVAAEAVFDVTFAAFGRFPGAVLWLEPEPADPFAGSPTRSGRPGRRRRRTGACTTASCRT